jgi:hypothetical protein
MEGINLTKLAIAASIEKHGMCRLAYAATEQTMLEAKQAMLEARQAMLEVDEETARLQLVLSTQVNAPLADGSDVTKRVPDDVLELVLRQLTMAELFRAGRVSRRWRLLVGRVSQMWPAMDVRYAKYAAGALEPRVLSGHAGSVHALVLSPLGQRLYSGSADSTVRVWSPAGGVLLQTLQGHTASVNALAVSADGQRLYSGSQDRTVRVWSTADGAQSVADAAKPHLLRLGAGVVGRRTATVLWIV